MSYSLLWNEWCHKIRTRLAMSDAGHEPNNNLPLQVMEGGLVRLHRHPSVLTLQPSGPFNRHQKGNGCIAGISGSSMNEPTSPFLATMFASAPLFAPSWLFPALEAALSSTDF